MSDGGEFYPVCKSPIAQGIADAMYPVLMPNELLLPEVRPYQLAGYLDRMVEDAIQRRKQLARPFTRGCDDPALCAVQRRMDYGLRHCAWQFRWACTDQEKGRKEYENSKGLREGTLTAEEVDKVFQDLSQAKARVERAKASFWELHEAVRSAGFLTWPEYEAYILLVAPR